MNNKSDEIFIAEPIYTENSWRVISTWGKVVGFRMTAKDAKKLANKLNHE